MTTSCPRCGRQMTVMANGKVRRHKDAGGNWCTGQPKSTAELVLELLDSVRAERKVLSDVIEGYVEFGDALARANEDYIARNTESTALIKAITESVHRDIEARKALAAKEN